jgi:hypothetical protein
MKRLVLLITLASLAAPHAGAPAAPRPRECPTITVSCPDTTGGGVPVTYTANVSGGPADVNPTYKWVVSAGTISSGQGTSSITVDTNGVPNGSTLTATVDVGGFSESCPKSAACSVTIPQGCRLYKIDEYGNLRFGDEKARLDNYAIELQNDPGLVGYIIGYGGRRSQRGEASRRTERAKKYLTTVRAIPAERVVTIDGGYREELTVELTLIPKDTPPPALSPTVDPAEVEFIRPAPKRRGRRR